MIRLNRAIARILPDALVTRIQRITHSGTNEVVQLRTEVKELKDEIDELRTDHRRLAQMMDAVEDLMLDARKTVLDDSSGEKR